MIDDIACSKASSRLASNSNLKHLEPVSKIDLCTIQEAPADETTANLEERFVNAWQPLVSDSQAPKPVQPSNGALDHPAGATQTATVLGVAPGDLALDAKRLEGSPVRIGIVRTISLYQLGFSSRSTALAANRRNRLNQRQQLSHVMAIGLGQNGRERNALRVGEEVVLGTGTTAIGWVRSRFFPAPSARMEELSAMAREKSIRLACRSFDSSTWCNRRQTPTRCQLWSRRQQVTPEPQPISSGNIFHGMPERSTKMIPVIAARSDTLGRPRPARARWRRRGSNGSITAHNSSSISGFDIAPLRGKQCRS